MTAAGSLARTLAVVLASILCRTVSAEAIFLHDGTIHTETQRGSIEHASVLIVDGRVKAIGGDLVAPAGAKTIELQGRPVTPGLFGGLGHMGLEEIGESASTADAVLKLGRMRPEFDPSLAFDPDSAVVAVNRTDGVAFALLVPGAEAGHKGAPGSSMLAGSAAIVPLDGRPARSPGALIINATGGANSLSGGSRAAHYMLLHQALQEIRNPASANSLDEKLLTPEGRRLLASALKTGRPFVVEVDKAADIRQVLAFGRREGIKIVIRGGAEAWRIAGELALNHVPVVLDPLEALPSSFDQVGTTLENAARLHAAGVRIAFSLRDEAPHNERKLRQAAGNAVAHGLPWASALAAITAVPADLFGAGDEFGRIEVGRRANLVVWSDDPLEVTSLAERMWLNGVSMSMRSRQTELRDRYLQRVRDGAAR
jgi:imidazolonepropionase-like amidohydrolase